MSSKLFKEIIFTEPKKTFMEVLEVHDKEVPMARLLAFFFRPNEKHGLGDLFIRALLNTEYSELSHFKKNEECSKGLDDLILDTDRIKVDVEYPVYENKRIDILIRGDEFVICIEFKINHELNNPLKIYRDYINNKFENKKKYFFVLTPYKKEAVKDAEEYLKLNDEFRQIILSKFIEKVKQQLPKDYFKINEGNTYAQYFKDFEITINNRKIRSERNKAYDKLLKGIIDSAKIKCEFHNNNMGGFLEIKKNNFVYKVRIVSSGWQIERWIEKKMDKIVSSFDKNCTDECLLKFIEENVN